jgi:hypothetical protein
VKGVTLRFIDGGIDDRSPLLKANRELAEALRHSLTKGESIAPSALLAGARFRGRCIPAAHGSYASSGTWRLEPVSGGTCERA